MRKAIRRTLAVLLVLLQLVVLPVAAMPAKAADTPVRNPVLERVTRFGSFGFNGDLEHQRDGIDYVLTYYYTDDHFSPSAVNPNATRKVMDWRDLENISLATLSKAFALSICSSSEGSVPVDWTHKSKNGERFFSECGFGNVFVSPDFNGPTGTDTLGYMIASKPITVWDERTGTNKPFTLVAIGVRGGGYGAEWASNLTIGDSRGSEASDKSYSGTYRHQGFQDGHDKVLRDLDAYLKDNHITGDVKYWVTGYSRSGAVADLLAGTLTDRADDYRTTIDDVYCYTYEAAAGALASEDPDGTRYPNIHNIINAMDLVPRISPAAFGHARLGVDYRMPFYGNTTPDENKAYFTRMRAVLPVVAALPDLYNRNVTGIESDPVEDSVITDSDPATYPYDRPMQIKSFKLANLLSGGLTQDVSNADSVIAPDEGLMFDEFLDQFVEKFVSSRAWDAALLKQTMLGWSDEDMTYDPLSHEMQYVRIYQHGMRQLAYALFKTPGKGFKSFGGLTDNILKAIDFETLWNTTGLATHYGLLHLGAMYPTHVHDMIDPAVTIVNKIVDVSGIFDEADIKSVHAAVRILMPALIWLYCEDHVKNNGEYLGTLMDNFSTIFVNHIPEMEVSWLMSLDPVFTCDYRELTVPRETEIRVRECRAQYGETLESASAPVIARIADGAVTESLDDRITVTTGEAVDDTGAVVDTVTVRYPACLDLRFDVTALPGAAFDDAVLHLEDFAPDAVVNAGAVCERDEKGHITSDAVDHTMLKQYTSDGAKTVNVWAAQNAVPLSTRYAVRILAPQAGAYTVEQTDLLALWRSMVRALIPHLDDLFAGLGEW